jgi:hypothetical protein
LLPDTRPDKVRGRLEVFAGEVLAGAVNRPVQLVNGGLYLRGLIEAGSRKSLEPLVSRLGGDADSSLLIAQGAHPKIIQERLGHASITTTMNRYGHVFDGLDATVIDGLDAAHDEAAAPATNLRRLQQAGVAQNMRSLHSVAGTR